MPAGLLVRMRRTTRPSGASGVRSTSTRSQGAPRGDELAALREELGVPVREAQVPRARIARRGVELLLPPAGPELRGVIPVREGVADLRAADHEVALPPDHEHLELRRTPEVLPDLRAAALPQVDLVLVRSE